MNSNWTKGKLEELAIIEMGQSPLGETCNQEGIGTPLLNGPTEFGEYHPTPVQFTTKARKFSVPNDILFCVRGSTTGSMNWADQKYAIGRGIAAMRHRSGTDYKYFLKALIELHLDQLLASATG
jgi:type I restriction enzyme S subunit